MREGFDFGGSSGWALHKESDRVGQRAAGPEDVSILQRDLGHSFHATRCHWRACIAAVKPTSRFANKSQPLSDDVNRLEAKIAVAFALLLRLVGLTSCPPDGHGGAN